MQFLFVHLKTSICLSLFEHKKKEVEKKFKILIYISLIIAINRKITWNLLTGGEADVFNSFKDSNGNFKSFLKRDIRGMLSLYEAAHLRVHGENILNEALTFTVTHLESFTSQSNTQLAAQVNRALNRPIRKSLPRLEAKHYMPIYQKDPSHNKDLLTFAMLDFNILQKQHQEELRDIVRFEQF